MPRLPDPLRGPLTRRFQTALVTVVDKATPTIRRLWDRLDNYDEESVEVLARAAAPPLQAVKAATVRQSAGYYTVLSGVRPPLIAVDEVPTTPTMRDPFISVWSALASGNSYDAAVLAGSARIVAVVTNFANSTARQTGDLFVAKANLEVHGWERIPNAGACPWCLSVAGQIYVTADSADFGHDRCSCTAAPAFD